MDSGPGSQVSIKEFRIVMAGGRGLGRECMMSRMVARRPGGESQRAKEGVWGCVVRPSSRSAPSLDLDSVVPIASADARCLTSLCVYPPASQGIRAPVRTARRHFHHARALILYCGCGNLGELV